MNGTTLLLLGAAAYAIYELSQPSAPTVQSSGNNGQFSFFGSRSPVANQPGYVPAGSPGSVSTADVQSWRQSSAGGFANGINPGTPTYRTSPAPSATLPSQVSSGGWDPDHPFGPAHDTYVAPAKTQAELDADAKYWADQKIQQDAQNAANWAAFNQCTNITGTWVTSRAGCGTAPSGMPSV